MSGRALCRRVTVLTQKLGSTSDHTALALCRRFQAFIGEQRPVARGQRGTYRHPLSSKDPAQRNVAITSHLGTTKLTGQHSSSTPMRKLTAEQIKKQAQDALLLQLQKEVLWEGTVIDDAGHSLIQHFVKLSHNPQYRNARRMVVVGGKAMIEELCAAGYRPRHLLVREGKEVPRWASDRSKTEIVRIDPRVAEACVAGNDGYIGDFEIPPPPMKEHLIANHQRLNRVLVLDNVDDPGVLGTVLRTAVGYQYDAIITTNHCADLYDHRVIRAARGAHFQSGVPIYSLRYEDGDDVDGMLNHIIRRNELRPLCYVAQSDSGTETEEPAGATGDSPTLFHSCVVGASPVVLPSVEHSPTSWSEKSASAHQLLDDFCLDQFSKLSAAQDDAKGGYMLFTGPNHKRNMKRQLARRLIRPTTQLLLDSAPDEPTDLLIGMSIVLHSLRPRGHWDYLPVSAQHETSNINLQIKQTSVDIGANRLSVSWRDINLDEDEQRQQANISNEFMKWRRLQRNQGSDYEHWMRAEESNVAAKLKAELAVRDRPWEVHRSPRTRSIPAWVPNIINEYRQSLDRDVLSHEQEVSSNYVRPK